jgi:hypothetical protein
VKISLFGENFQFQTLNGLYLSSSNPSMTSINLDIYTNVKSISAKFPAISVFPVENFEVKEIKLFPYDKFGLKKRYDVEFILPRNLLSGNYDIIYFNAAGYSKASDSKRFTYFKII